MTVTPTVLLALADLLKGGTVGILRKDGSLDILRPDQVDLIDQALQRFAGQMTVAEIHSAGEPK